MSHDIISGYGSVKELSGILQKSAPKHILLVTGEQSYTSCGAQKAIEPLLGDYPYTRFSDFEVNVKVEDLQRGIDLFRQHQCDYVIGIGGGSVMDMAKAIALLAREESSLESVIKGDVEIVGRDIGSVMIPTTAGTGSESDRYSVVYIGKTKYSLTHDSNLPDYALLDATFTLDLPKKITAVTGMDALAQSIESYWSVQSTETSRALSKQALELVLGNLEGAVNHPDKKNREQMLIAANLAGQAIHIASTTAPHAVSYTMTSYFGVAHGQAVGVTLPSFFEYNCGVDAESVQGISVEDAQQRMQELLGILGVETGTEAKVKLTSLLESIGLKSGLREIDVDDIDVVVEHGFNPARMGNNPRKVGEEDLKTLLSGLH